MPTNDVTVRDYTGPCIDLIPRCRVVDVTRGGRVETVAMPMIDDEPLVGGDAAQTPLPVGRHSGG